MQSIHGASNNSGSVADHEPLGSALQSRLAGAPVDVVSLGGSTDVETIEGNGSVNRGKCHRCKLKIFIINKDQENVSSVQLTWVAVKALLAVIAAAQVAPVPSSTMMFSPWRSLELWM